MRVHPPAAGAVVSARCELLLRRGRGAVLERPLEVAALALVLAVGGWLRLRQLGLMEFKVDEAVAIRAARDILHGSVQTVGLTSSVGAKNPPLFVYLAAVPLVFDDDPVAATAFVGVLALAAVALTYVAIRPRFGAFTALFASTLLATAPWAVLYGRKLWAQDMLPLVTVTLLWSLFAVLERSRARAVFFVPLLLSFAIQLNFSALALCLPVLVVLGYRARALHPPSLCWGVLAAVLGLAPWLAHNARHRFTDFLTLAREGRGHAKAPFHGSFAAIRQTADLVAQRNWKYLTGSSETRFAHSLGAVGALTSLAGTFVIALLAFGCLSCAVCLAHGTHRRAAWPYFALDAGAARRGTLLVWLVGIWLSYVDSAPSQVYPHYLIVSYPVSFLVAALGLVDLSGIARGLPGVRAPVSLVTGAAVAVAIATTYVAFTVEFHRFLARNGGTAGDYGVLYRDTAALARAVRDRGLHAASPAVEFLANGSLAPPGGATPLVEVSDRLVAPGGPRCRGDTERFGPLLACFPVRSVARMRGVPARRPGWPASAASPNLCCASATPRWRSLLARPGYRGR